MLKYKLAGKMFPTQGDLHVTPFTDEALFMEQFSKANFWYVLKLLKCNKTSYSSFALFINFLKLIFLVNSSKL